MKKDYRNYTVGELLDMGFSIEANISSRNQNELINTLNKFEGIDNTLEFGEEIHGRVRRAEINRGKFRIVFSKLRQKNSPRPPT